MNENLECCRPWAQSRRHWLFSRLIILEFWRSWRHVPKQIKPGSETPEHGSKPSLRKLQLPAFDYVRLDCNFAAATVKRSLA